MCRGGEEDEDEESDGDGDEGSDDDEDNDDKQVIPDDSRGRSNKESRRTEPHE